MRLKLPLLLFLVSFILSKGISQIDTTSVIIYPNPCDSIASQTISLMDNQTLKVSLYDVRGNLIYRLEEKNYKETVQLSALINPIPQGAYIVVTEIGEKRITNKLIYQGNSSSLNLNFDIQVSPYLTDENTIKLFPNPAVNQDIKVEMKSSSSSVKSFIYNSSGQLIYNKEIFTQNGYVSLIIPSADWMSGQYLIKIISDSGETNSRFLKIEE